MNKLEELLAGLKPIEGKELEDFWMQVNENKEKQAKELEVYFHKKQIDEEEIYDVLLTYADSEDRWQLFADFVENGNLTDKAFNVGLKEAWTCGKGTGDFRALAYFKKADKILMMNDEELAYYSSLPDRVTLYRGCNKGEVEDEDSALGISWTIERKVAEFFAFRFEQTDTAVYSIEVEKKNIDALFLNRKEYEAICLGVCEEDITLITDTPTEYYNEFIEEHKKEQYNMIHNLKDTK